MEGKKEKLNEMETRKRLLLGDKIEIGDIKICIDASNEEEKGSTCLVYEGHIEDEKGIIVENEMIIKEFYPISGQKDKFDIKREGRKLIISDKTKQDSEYKMRLRQFEAGFEMQKKLSKSDMMEILVKPYFYGKYGDSYYLVSDIHLGKSMDKVHFSSLKEKILAIICVLDTIAMLHDSGYLLIDFKPENLLWVEATKRNKVVYLMDIDSVISYEKVGKIQFRDLRYSKSYAAPQLKQFIEICYMEPYQFESKKKIYLTPKVNTYSIGVYLFELLFGWIPEEGDEEKIEQILSEQKWKLLGREKTDEIHSQEREALKKLERILKKALSKRPLRQYSSAQKFLEDLNIVYEILTSNSYIPRRQMEKANAAFVAYNLLERYPLYLYSSSSDIRNDGQCHIRDDGQYHTQDDVRYHIQDDVRYHIRDDMRYHTRDAVRQNLKNNVSEIAKDNIRSDTRTYAKLKEGVQILDLTIVGSHSSMRKTMLQNAISIGQMLDCKLEIHLLAQDTEEFWESFNEQNPELKNTVEWSTNRERIHSDIDEFITYEPFAYIDCLCWRDKEERQEKINVLAEQGCRYFVLLEEEEEENRELAKILIKRFRERESLEQEEYFIGYLQYETLEKKEEGDFAGADFAGILKKDIGDLAIKAAKEETRSGVRDKTGDGYITVYPISAYHLSEVYHETIYKEKLFKMALKVHEYYLGEHRISKKREKMLAKELYEDMYSMESSERTAVHSLYKLASFGIYDKTWRNMREFEAMITEEDKQAFFKLAWLEHRSWTAYMVTHGAVAVRGEEQIREYAYQNGNDWKDRSGGNLHIAHPCIRASKAERKLAGYTNWSEIEDIVDTLDPLDKCSYEVWSVLRDIISERKEEIEEKFDEIEENFRKMEKIFDEIAKFLDEDGLDVRGERKCKKHEAEGRFKNEKRERLEDEKKGKLEDEMRGRFDKIKEEWSETVLNLENLRKDVQECIAYILGGQIKNDSDKREKIENYIKNLQESFSKNEMEEDKMMLSYRITCPSDETSFAVLQDIKNNLKELKLQLKPVCDYFLDRDFKLADEKMVKAVLDIAFI